MRGLFKISIFLVVSMVFSGCLGFGSLNPFSSSTFEVKEGYLSIGKINENILLQLPLQEKIGTNKIKIVAVKTYAGSNHKSLIVEVDFIFTSFEIPEGVPAIARFSSMLGYNTQSREFKFRDLNIIGVRFLKEQLVEYITPQQKRFIPDAIKMKLQEIVLHKSKKKFSTIKSFEAKEGKIKIVFR
jgi:hypothetical protein